MIIPELKVDFASIQLDPKAKRLKAGWYTWCCPATGDFWMYYSKKNKHPKSLASHINQCPECQKGS